MANRNFDNSYVMGKRIVEISGSFATNGSSNPVAANVKGLGFGYGPQNGVMAARAFPQVPGVTTSAGIVRSGTGQYDITFEDPFIDANAIGCDLQVPSASANWCQFGPASNLNTSNKGPSLRLFTINSSGTAVDIAADPSSRVHFFAVFRDSNVGFNKP